MGFGIIVGGFLVFGVRRAIDRPQPYTKDFQSPGFKKPGKNKQICGPISDMFAPSRPPDAARSFSHLNLRVLRFLRVLRAISLLPFSLQTSRICGVWKH
jgi:hypothetical protein